MKYTNEDINLENGIQKEWIITNGIGGFASSTIIGAIQFIHKYRKKLHNKRI